MTAKLEMLQGLELEHYVNSEKNESLFREKKGLFLKQGDVTA